MKMYVTKHNRKKENVSSVPNAIAYKFIRGFITSNEFNEVAESLFIKKLNKQQVNTVMEEIKWLFRNYPGLEVMVKQDEKGNITRYTI